MSTDDKDDIGDEAPESAIPESQLPRLDFVTFVLGVIGSAFVHLGDAPDPESGAMMRGTIEPNLLLAQQDIDLLALLSEKTRGNLTGDEERVLEQGLYDLRMRFLEVTKGM